jgi:hypothetical protein
LGTIASALLFLFEIKFPGNRIVFFLDQPGWFAIVSIWGFEGTRSHWGHVVWIFANSVFYTIVTFPILFIVEKISRVRARSMQSN